MKPNGPNLKQRVSDTSSQGFAERVRKQLDRLLSSTNFKATDMQKAFLQFVVEKSLARQADEIKGFTVATEVFGRSAKFDQSSDPIVSIQANKLRRALQLYYLTAGKQDSLHIEIPKGTYVPVFHETQPQKLDPTQFDELRIDETMDSWPSLLVLPLKNLTGDVSKNFVGVGLATELAIEIAHFNEIRVLRPVLIEGEKTDSRDARFVISGNVYQYDENIKIAVQLTDQKTGEQIWGESYQSSLNASGLAAFPENTAGLIAIKIAGVAGAIASVISSESKTKAPAELMTYEAILRFNEYDQLHTPESFAQAMQSLEQAKKIEPDCSRVLSRLARLHANSYNLDYPGSDDPLELAVEYAERAVDLNPYDQHNLIILSLVRFSSNELSTAVIEVKRALALNPNSLFMMDAIAYFLLLSGDWEAGEALANKAISLNPYYRTEIHYALWLNLLRQGKYEEAYLELQRLRKPTILWYPLSKAATLGLMGKCEESKIFVDKLLQIRPDFPVRGRILIERYIKFKNLVELVISGLKSAGLVVD